MAAEGEERLLTLFGDIHYWFSPPSPRPASHRFDKESYVYLYHDAAQQRGRLEIANHAGTPEQDAFTGYLDNSKISQSHRHPTLVTITVDGFKSDSVPGAQSSDWRLPSTDPRDEGKYLFRLHTLDVYFWTKDDAAAFVRSTQLCLNPEQLDIDYPIPNPHSEVISPVVQQLENVAISDPAYQNGKTRNSAPGSSQALAKAEPKQEQEKEQVNYAPLAYNPAAPPAPEKRAHREKTPPPPDSAGGTGLAGAAYDDVHPQHPLQPQLSGSSVLPPPSNHTPQATATQAYTGVPNPVLSPYAPSPSSTAASISSPPSTAPTHYSYIPSAAGAAAATAALKPPSEPLESPTAQILGRSYLTSPTQPLQHLQPAYADYLAAQQMRRQSSSSSHGPPAAAPPGGYSNYDYAAAQAAHSQAAYGGHPAAPGGGTYYPTNTGDYSIHAQVYRPTEEEAGGKPGREGKAGPGQQPGKWEQKAEKAEKGINRLLRKVEKKIG